VFTSSCSGLGRVGSISFLRISGSDWVGSRLRWVGSGWVKQNGPMDNSDCSCIVVHDEVKVPSGTPKNANWNFIKSLTLNKKKIWNWFF
jgi:hypothetical protein